LEGFSVLYVNIFDHLPIGYREKQYCDLIPIISRGGYTSNKELIAACSNHYYTHHFGPWWGYYCHANNSLVVNKAGHSTVVFVINWHNEIIYFGHFHTIFGTPMCQISIFNSFSIKKKFENFFKFFFGWRKMF
jgi:hypothetical protein